MNELATNGEFTIQLTSQMMALAGVVGAILQVAKRIDALDKIKEFFPFLGIGVAYALARSAGLEEPVMGSVLVGLVASGGYDLLTGPVKSKKKKKK